MAASGRVPNSKNWLHSEVGVDAVTVTEGFKSAGSLRASEIAQLRGNLDGQLTLPEDRAYEDGRKVWNGTVDKRPAMIFYCASAEDVIEAVNFARSRELLVAVRSGGHNVAGCSVCDDGVVFDLSRMKRIEVDPVRRIAHAEAGLTLGEFDTATQSYGLATTMGVNGDTGIAGLTLGGGFGKLGRKYGLTCDNLIAADIVTADGRLLRASEAENPDLFWGIRGGGGNFGIVTTFEYRLHAVGPKLLAGSLLYRYEHARDAMRFYCEFSINAPDELSADAALVTSPSGERFFAISACYIGPVEEGEGVVRPLREFGKPVESRFAPVPYLQIQSGNDTTFPRGRRYYWKAQFLREISDRAIDALLAAYAGAPIIRFTISAATGWRRDRASSEIRNALREPGCPLRLLSSRDLGRSGRRRGKHPVGAPSLERNETILDRWRLREQSG
jgi:hypothetical protein